MTVIENTETTFRVNTEGGVIVRAIAGAYGRAYLDVGERGDLFSHSNLSHKDAHAFADWIKANVPEPKPAWHDAKDGEVWIIKLRSNKNYPGEMAAVVQGDTFFFKSAFAYPEPDSVEITEVESARCIWPAPEGDTNA